MSMIMGKIESIFTPFRHWCIGEGGKVSHEVRIMFVSPLQREKQCVWLTCLKCNEGFVYDGPSAIETLKSLSEALKTYFVDA